MVKHPGSRRRSVPKPPFNSEGHPTPETMDDWVFGNLSINRSACSRKVRLHLGGCEECQAKEMARRTPFQIDGKSAAAV